MKRKVYSKDLQEQVMELRHKDNVSVEAISQQFGIPIGTIYSWSRRYELYKDEAFVGSGNQRKANAELSKLKKENTRLKEENDLLKKLAAYQAKLQAGKK